MKYFLIIAQRPDKINNLSIAETERQFYEQLSPELGTTLVYPRNASHRSFRGVVTRQEGLKISVCNPDFPPHFNNGDFPNLLFFKHSVDAHTLRLIFTNPDEGGQRLIAIYHAVTSPRGINILAQKNIRFGGNDNLWQHYSALSQHLFIQEIGDFPANSDDCYLNVQSVQTLMPNDDDEVWLNPICLRLPLTGGELQQESFDLWAENTQPLWLEPLFPSEQAPRIQFYQYGDKQIQARKTARKPAEHLSRLEKLIWSDTDYYHRWQAFAALDTLQGHFHIDNNKQRYYWQAPDELNPMDRYNARYNACYNARYFANYWLERWHGEEVTESPLSDAIHPPSYTKDFRYAAGTGWLPLKNNACQDRETLFNCFGLLNKPVYQVIQAVLERCPNNHTAHQIHHGYLTVHDNQGDEYALRFNAQAYLYEFAQRYIIPFSQISIDFPPAEFSKKEQAIELCKIQQAYFNEAIKELHFDPIYSTFHGARGFFQRLTESLVKGLQETDQVQTLNLGWWNHWHDWLYKNTTTSTFRFHLPTDQLGPRVGHAKVGKTTYLGGHNLYKQDKTMCF